jgi:hypothetical protein
MKFNIGLVALLVAREATGAALYGGALTNQQLIEALINRPNLLPESSKFEINLLTISLLIFAGQRMLEARLQELNRTLSLSKRSPQKDTYGITASDVWYSMVQVLAGTLTQNQLGKIPPAAKVPELVDTPANGYQDYPGAKRRKIRYGPYRIPSNTVSLFGALHSLSNLFGVGEKS